MAKENKKVKNSVLIDLFYDEVRKIYEAVMKAAPDYDIKMIRESLA